MSGAALHEPWRSLRRQREAASFGTWVFLAGEALFFGGLILAFLATRVRYPEAFATAARETDVVLGTVNTALLLTSSLTAAVAAEAARAGLRRPVLWGFGLTLALGLGFLGVKGIEYAADFGKYLVPGPGFALRETPPAQLFFAFYWVMTGLHALHMAAGLALLGLFLVQAARRTRPLASPAYEAGVLYWHLVDVVWVFLYPLLYLAGRA